MVRILLYVVLGIPVVAVALHTLIRIVRSICKFPIPPFLADAIDNPLRHRLQPPDLTPARHGIAPGMRVLEVGPGNGTYTLATARWVGDEGKVVTIDIEPTLIERVRRRAAAEGVANMEARVADVFDLPFDDESFDAIYMLAVIGEIPTPERAMAEFYRVLRPEGTLAFGELLMDPDYPLPRTLTRWASSAGFRLREKAGNLFYYTLVFRKESTGGGCRRPESTGHGG
jgi:ubiquinone/menaquinone biosynthesis C-methylase UbiE